MEEFFNFKDSWILVGHNWIWLLIALALGIWVGWSSATPERE
jgi:hypothetical protein